MAEVADDDEIERLRDGAFYDTSCYHEHNTTGWRPDKSKCPPHVDGQIAEGLLMEGIRRSMFSAKSRQGWPQNVWAVDEDGVLYEAQLTNQGQGQYHGYPIIVGNKFFEFLETQWEERA